MAPAGDSKGKGRAVEIVAPLTVENLKLANKQQRASMAPAVQAPVTAAAGPSTQHRVTSARQASAVAGPSTQAHYVTESADVDAPDCELSMEGVGQTFSTDTDGEGNLLSPGHFVRICIASNDRYVKLKELTYKFNWAKELRVTKNLNVDNESCEYIVQFDSLQYAEHVPEQILSQHPEMVVDYASQEQYFESKGREHYTSSQRPNRWDGQVVFATEIMETDHTKCSIDAVLNKAFIIASEYGRVRSMEIVGPADSFPKLDVRVEYDRISDARVALVHCSLENPAVDEDYIIHTKRMTPDLIINNDPEPEVPMSKQAGKQPVRDPAPEPEPVRRQFPVFVPAAQRQYQQSQHSMQQGQFPTGVPVHNHRGNVGYHNNQHSGMYNHRPHYNRGLGGRRQALDPNHPQFVHVDKIENGEDIRTTVMLRNIPHHCNVNQVKDVVDVRCKGTYNFLYLRIDFSINMNVGYGFVDFESPAAILPFMSQVGQRWVSSNNRCVEISYATIQGIDCLIEKFRNSAIMDEPADFKPKLFLTPDSVASQGWGRPGDEIPFPAPNNLSKKQRSKDNATSVGLYARSAPERTERRHRSQYDRGTPAQLQEAQLNDLIAMTTDNQGNIVASNHQNMMMQPAQMYPVGPWMVPNQNQYMNPQLQNNGYNTYYGNMPQQSMQGSPVMQGFVQPNVQPTMQPNMQVNMNGFHGHPNNGMAQQYAQAQQYGNQPQQFQQYQSASGYNENANYIHGPYPSNGWNNDQSNGNWNAAGPSSQPRHFPGHRSTRGSGNGYRNHTNTMPRVVEEEFDPSSNNDHADADDISQFGREIRAESETARIFRMHRDSIRNRR